MYRVSIDEVKETWVLDNRIPYHPIITKERAERYNTSKDKFFHN